MPTPTHHQAVTRFIEAAQVPIVAHAPPLAVPPLPAPFHITLRPPGSKSLSNRALLLASLASGTSHIYDALTDADDAMRMIDAARQLGAHIEIVSDPGRGGYLRVQGVGGRWRTTLPQVDLFLNNAGTAVRFFAGAAMLSPVPILIDGNQRMRQRPIAELGDLLAALGCAVEYLGGTNFPPVRISPPTDLHSIPSTLSVGATHSSQFISALLLIAPWLPHGLTLRLLAEPTSASYIRMTTGLLARLGVPTQESNDGRVVRVGGDYKGLQGFSYSVEPDASGATYFWAAAAVTPGAKACVQGLDESSLQGDSDFPLLLRRMGCRVDYETQECDSGPQPMVLVDGPATLRPILADMSDMPDAAMTLACVAAFAPGTSILRGLKTLRVKETDRIAAMQTELAKVGVRVATDVAGDPDAVTITPPLGGVDVSPDAAAVTFDTYDDHRMAMAMSIIALHRPNVTINDPACVRKTFPTFWKNWSMLYTAPRGDEIDITPEQDAALDRACERVAEQARRDGRPVFEPDWSKPLPDGTRRSQGEPLKKKPPS